MRPTILATYHLATSRCADIIDVVVVVVVVVVVKVVMIL
jgi:hypothetical protein